MQYKIGSCSIDRVAVAMACPVVAIHKERNEMVIYGGAVHFSKERLEDPVKGACYGVAVENNGEGWGDLMEGVCLTKLSQEHGIVHVPDHLKDHFRIGDIIKILPVHSCLAADLMKSYGLVNGGDGGGGHKS
jgi:D-serine deaminase-like pyridoxal phosphate-dependent protein